MKRIHPVFLLLLLLWGGMCTPVVAQRSLFPLGAVRLLDSPFKTAEKADIKYILSLDVERLTAPFYREAGLTPKAKPYGNWESMGLDGHTAGHYLTAISQAWVITQDPEIRKRLDTMLAELEECQNASTNGFLGGTPGSRALWDGIYKADFKPGEALKGTWVPWYNQHKTLAGLRDVWLLTANPKARKMFLKMCDWCCLMVSNLSEQQMQQMLGTEYGGMNEVLADAFAFTGDQRYMDVAKRFSHRDLLEPLIREEDKLTGMHANTQIPKVIGFERIGELSHNTSWENAAEFFWENVTGKRSISIGGNSVSEHFNPTSDFSGMLRSKEGPESCNTYNMLKLSRMLWVRTGGARYLNFYERALYNHILSTEHPHGGFVYFTPIRPRHYRVYSTSQDCFWCCVGTGLENHTKYGELIYAYDPKNLFVNLYMPSRLNWKEQGLTLTQTGDLSKTDRIRFDFSLKAPKRFALQMRIPDWTSSKEVQLRLNGVLTRAMAVTDSSLTLERIWKKGDWVELSLPMHLQTEQLPDQSKWASFRYGPWVLAAATDSSQLTGLYADGSRMGHVANGPLLPIDQAPYFITKDGNALGLLNRVPGTLSFRMTGPVFPANGQKLILQPFYQIHDARYMLYWNILRPEEYAATQEKFRKDEAERVLMDTRTLDRVSPGEQQPEKDHAMQAEQSQTGIYNDRHWRHASGWFSYELLKPLDTPVSLLITLSGDDVNRHFVVKLNDQVLTTLHTAEGHRGEFYNIETPIPAAMLASAAGKTITVRFEAVNGSIAGGVYDVRLVKSK